MNGQLKKELRRLLEDNNFLPLSDWKCFELFHLQPRSAKDRNRTYSEIRKNVERKSGVYVYEKDGERLYVGKGKPLCERIRSHYKESFEEVPEDTKSKPWYEFFSSHQGRVKIYWRGLKGEQNRTIVEQMLHYVLKPKFDSFKKEYKLKEKEKERQR